MLPTSIIPAKTARNLTLVPNRRRLDMHVAESLRRDAGSGAIVAPPVAVFSQWVEALLVRICLLDGTAAPASLDAESLVRIWAEALETGMVFLAQGERTLATRQARAADRLLRHWWAGDDTPWLEHTFWAARSLVAGKLSARHALSAEGWLEGLAQRLASPAALPCTLPEQITLDGFHEVTRLEQKVFDALAQRGVNMTSPAPSEAAATHITRHSFAGLEEELSAAAHWAQERLQAGCSRIAVVINGAQDMPEKIRETFASIIGGEQQLALDERIDCAFHIAHGEHLSNHAVVQDALALLALALDGLDRQHEFPAISRWLLSPFWQGADRERFARALLELKLRRNGRYGWTLRELGQKAASHKPYGELSPGRDDAVQILLECIGRLEQALAKPSARQQSAAALFFDILQAWGWPGPLALGVDVTRGVSQFSALLEKLDGLTSGSNAEALNLLRQMCAESTLVLRGGPLSPLQVLSPEDAAGRRFEAAWIANMHAANWPGQAMLNPFLPSRAARCIPRSTAEGELAYCERLTVLLSAIAPELRFSWSRQAEDVPNAVSPLLEHLPAIDVERAPTASAYARAAPGAERLRTYLKHPWLRPATDTRGLPLRPAADTTPAEAIPGGAGMFRDQSGCPMLAYYRYRLKAAFEDMPAPFADAAFRGNLMHSALYFLFAAQAESGRPGRPGDDDIGRAVEQALHKHEASQRLFAVSYRAERQRLVRLLGQWLDFEASRTGFEVQHLEQPIHLELQGHPLAVQADRLDRLRDGSLLVIDYKSSPASASGWSRERLRQAQLPLYAVLLSRQPGPAVSGIALATVRGGECGLAGIVADPAAKFDQVKSFDDRRSAFTQRFADWPVLFSHWEQSIDDLAGEIVRGVCENAVYDPQCLTYAGLDILLRRAEGEAWCLVRGGGEFAVTGDDDDAAC